MLYWRGGDFIFNQILYFISILSNVVITDFLMYNLLYELTNLRDNYLMFSGDFNQCDFLL